MDATELARALLARQIERGEARLPWDHPARAGGPASRDARLRTAEDALDLLRPASAEGSPAGAERGIRWEPQLGDLIGVTKVAMDAAEERAEEVARAEETEVALRWGLGARALRRGAREAVPAIVNALTWAGWLKKDPADPEPEEAALARAEMDRVALLEALGHTGPRLGWEEALNNVRGFIAAVGSIMAGEEAQQDQIAAALRHGREEGRRDALSTQTMRETIAQALRRGGCRACGAIATEAGLVVHHSPDCPPGSVARRTTEEAREERLGELREALGPNWSRDTWPHALEVVAGLARGAEGWGRAQVRDALTYGGCAHCGAVAEESGAIVHVGERGEGGELRGCPREDVLVPLQASRRVLAGVGEPPLAAALSRDEAEVVADALDELDGGRGADATEAALRDGLRAALAPGREARPADVRAAAVALLRERGWVLGEGGWRHAAWLARSLEDALARVAGDLGEPEEVRGRADALLARLGAAEEGAERPEEGVTPPQDGEDGSGAEEAANADLGPTEEAQRFLLGAGWVPAGFGTWRAPSRGEHRSATVGQALRIVGQPHQHFSEEERTAARRLLGWATDPEEEHAYTTAQAAEFLGRAGWSPAEGGWRHASLDGLYETIGAITKTASTYLTTVPEELRAEADALLYGSGYLVDGKRVAPQLVRAFTRSPGAGPLREAGPPPRDEVQARRRTTRERPE